MGNRLGSWKYVAASVIGSSHTQSGSPCQDHSTCVAIGEDGLLVVASDGAGSAEHSAIGATLVCSTLHERMVAFVDSGGQLAKIESELVDEWFATVVDRLRIQALALGVPIRELAATLVAAVLTETSAAYFQIGDGGIVVGVGGQYQVAMWPASGEYANTTFFVTDDDARASFRISLNAPPVDEVAVFTDGLQALTLNFAAREVHAPFFDGLFPRLRAEPSGESSELTDLLKEYLDSARINQRTDDDKTLILATRLGSLVAAAPAFRDTDAGSENAA